MDKERAFEMLFALNLHALTTKNGDGDPQRAKAIALKALPILLEELERIRKEEDEERERDRATERERISASAFPSGT